MNRIKIRKPIDYYIKAYYPVTLYKEPEGGYVSEIEDLPGCLSEGETAEEALSRIEDARQAWIETAYEDGLDIPLPRNDQQYSGKFIVRLPRSLHRKLAEQASYEGVSLNQYVLTMLSSSTTLKSIPDVINHLQELPFVTSLNRRIYSYATEKIDTVEIKQFLSEKYEGKVTA